MIRLADNEFCDLELSELQHNVACNIRRLRIENSISQRDLAAWSNMEYSNLCRIESGRTNVTLRTLLRLSLVLNADIRQFFEPRK